MAQDIHILLEVESRYFEQRCSNHLWMGLVAPKLLHFSTNCMFNPGTFLGMPRFIGLLAILGRFVEEPLQCEIQEASINA